MIQSKIAAIGCPFLGSYVLEQEGKRLVLINPGTGERVAVETTSSGANGTSINLKLTPSQVLTGRL